MSKYIFYGAGQYAQYNIAKWLDEGIEPLCFADKDTRIHHTMFSPNHGGGWEILSLEEALARFTDAKIFISVQGRNWESVRDYLVEKGVAAEKIHIPDNMAYYKSCWKCSHMLLTSVDGMRHCTYSKLPITKYSKPLNSVKDLDELEDVLRDTYARFRENINAEIERRMSGKMPSCGDCFNWREGLYPKESEQQYISIAFLSKNSACNFNCCYCTNHPKFSKKQQQNTLNFSYLDFLTAGLKAIKGPNMVFRFGYSELTLDPDFDEILDVLKKNDVNLYVDTSAFLYKESISEFLATGRMREFRHSMDAGTRETFKKIKGVDGFDRVVENMKRYSKSDINKVTKLKYIICPEMNDNVEEFSAFLDICEGITNKIEISSDHRLSPTPPRNIEMIHLFEQMAIERGFNVQIWYECLYKDGYRSNLVNNDL